MANTHFCQEFFDDVVVPAENLIGDENSGWAVAQTLLFHERNATAGVGYGVGLTGSARSGGDTTTRATSIDDLIRRARARGVAHDGAIRQLIGEAYVESVVTRHVSERIMTGMRVGAFKGQWGSLLKLGMGVNIPRMAEIAVAVSGDEGVIWTGQDDHAEPGRQLLSCRVMAIAGGSNEMQRNIVSERLLGLPREPSFDRDVPFNEVIRNRGKIQDVRPA